MDEFVDRRREQEAFHKRWSKRSSFALVYGQRRVGKTYLLQHLTDDDPDAIYFLADESVGASLLERFCREVGQRGRGGAGWGASRPSDWSTALSLLVQAEALAGRRLLLVLDECQYLLAAAPELTSVLQRLWDESHRRQSLHLVLCGSALGVLSRLGDSGQPLHGRFDLQLELSPFDFRQTAEFVPRWAPVEKLRLFGTFGHLARHLAAVEPERSLGENVCEQLLAPLSALQDAPLDMLRSEHLGSFAEASAVLSAIAHGEDRFNNIAARTGLTAARIDQVFKALLALQMIRKEVRYGDAPGARFARYRCADPFTAFWYRHVLAHRSALFAAPPTRIYAERVAPRLDDLMGPVFEEVTRQAVSLGLLQGLFGAVDSAAGWWSRDGRTQIDLIASAEAGPVFIECEWRPGGTIGLPDLQRLRGHVARAFPTIEAPRLALVTAGAADSRLATVAAAEGIGLYGTDALLPGR